MENKLGLGEMGETVQDLEYENSSADVDIDTTKYSPNFYPEEKKDKKSIIHCKTCGNQCNEYNVIDGECPLCAVKRLRKLENRLVQLNQIKKERDFCAIDGHGEIYKNKLHPDWEGKFVINGIELYPVFPLCKDCLDILSAYFVYFFEERGILRRGSGHIKNKFSQEYGMPINKKDRVDALARLNDFMNAASVYVFDQMNPMNILYKELKERRKLLLGNEQKGMAEWLKEREVKLPSNTLETLKLAEKYYLCLRKDGIGEQERKSKEIEWLKTQPVPEEVKKIEEKKFLEIMKQYVPQRILQKLQEHGDQNQKLTVQDLVHRLGEAGNNGKKATDFWKMMVQIIGSDIIPFADFAEGILTEIVEKYTMSDLISKLMTERSKQEQSKSAVSVSTGSLNI